MGNQELRKSFQAITEPDFEATGDVQEVYLSLAFKGATKEQCQTFLGAINAFSSGSGTQWVSEKMQECFPNHSTINFTTGINNESRWDGIAKELWQSGYTSWHHNLVAVNGSGYKDVVMAQNRDTAKYEFEFYSRSMMLASNFMLRHQSGSDIKDIFTYFREQFDSSSAEYAFTTTAQTAFMAVLTGLMTNVTSANQLETVIDALLMSTAGVDNGALFKRDKAGMQLDLLLRRVREIIENVIRGDSSFELKTKCVQALLRIGTLTGCPEDLIMAAQYQFEFKIDISSYLGYFLAEEAEIYEEPKSATEDAAAAFKLLDKKRLQDKCDYEGHGSNRQHTHDTMACNGGSYFTYSDERGLTRAERNSNDENRWVWKKTNENDNVKGLTNVNFLVHLGQLYIRHSKVEKGFLLISTEEMTIKTDAPVEFADEATTQRFSWTTSENAVVEDRGKRWMHSAPMASDGTLIYTIVEWRKNGKDSDRVATMLETYSFVDNKLTFIKEIKLKDQAEESWFGKAGDNLDHGGYFDHGHFACNGVNAVWHSKKNVHIFDVKTGIRKIKVNRHSGAHINCFDSASSNWYSCDADCYSWLEEWQIKGFKTIIKTDDEEEGADTTLPPVPVILAEPKAEIKESIISTSSPKYQLNLLSQLIGGKMEVSVEAETQANYQEARETAAEERQQKLEANPPKRDLTESDWLFDYTRAIILSHVSVEAQKKNFFARSIGSKQLDGGKMLEYFKSKWGIQISENTFKQLRMSITEVLSDYELNSATISQRFTLKSLLHIYIAHIGCLRPLKISIRQFMSAAEMVEQEALISKLNEIKLFAGQKPTATEDDELPDEQLFQLHIYHLSKQVFNEMQDMLSSKTIEQKLCELLTALEDLKNQKESPEVIRLLKRYTASELATIFSQDKPCIEKMMEIFDTTSALIDQRINQRVEEMLEDKDKIEDDFGGFGTEETQALAEFSHSFVQELLAKYGNHIKALLDNVAPEKPEDEDKEKTEKRIKSLKVANEGKELLNDYVYDLMIKTSEGFNHLLRQVSITLLKQAETISKYDEEVLTSLHQKIDTILTGKTSHLKAVLMFVMATQLYEVGGNDLDECAIALRAAVEGLSYFIANIQTLVNRFSSLKPYSEKLVEELVQSNRFVHTGLNKVSARFVFDNYSDSKAASLSKYQVFEHGIAQNYIPLLSKDCKDGIEGSFKLIEDEKLRKLTLMTEDDVEHKEGQQWIQSIAKGGDEIFDKMLELLNAENGQSSEVDEQVEIIVRHAFAALLLFGNHIDNDLKTIKEALENDSESLPEDSPEKENVLRVYKKACQMREWSIVKTREVKEDLKNKLIEEFRKEYAEKNPSASDLPSRPSAEHKAIIDERLASQSADKVSAAMKDTIEKCKLLLWFDTEGSKMQIDAEGIFEKNNSAKWADWDIHIQASNVANKENSENEMEDTQRDEDQVMEVIKESVTSETMRSFIEDGQVKGLRRVAGIAMFNQSLQYHSGEFFYDTLHFWEASLRGNKANVSSYLQGVEGCGGITAGKIRQQFFNSLRLIIKMISVEQDEVRLVLLLNALLWDYENADLEVLAKNDIFNLLSGAPEQFNSFEWNKFYTAWGKESSCYSVQNGDDSTENMSSHKYSLSARLRQAFDFFANKLLSVVFKQDGSYHRNMNLKKVGDYLMQQLFDVCNGKMNQHLKMLKDDSLGAADRRDQEIRVDNVAGEQQDDPEVKLWDEFLYGYALKDDKKARRMVEEYIYRLEIGEETIDGINGEIMKNFTDFKTDEVIKDAIVTRNWRVYAYLKQNTHLFNIELEDEEDEEGPNEEVNEANKAIEVAEKKLHDLHEAVEEQGSDKQRTETYLAKLQEAEIEGKDSSKVQFYSQQSLMGFVQFYWLVFSLSESSRAGSEILKKILTEQAIATLVSISVNGACPVQCLTQRIFQNMLRLKIPLNNLNNAVTMASNNSTLVSQIKDYTGVKIRLDSGFWQFLFNQIYMTTEAQQTNTLSVEKGKAVVIQEIIRTFYIVQKDTTAEYSQNIRKKILDALILIDNRNSVEIATLFSLVPEAHIPIITTGSRCYDQETKESMIVLGFANLADVSKNYQAKLSMVQVSDAQVIGLKFSQGRILRQTQKRYNLQYLTPTPLAQIYEDDDLTEEQRNAKVQEITKQTSIYMNPEFMTRLINRMLKKDQQIRSTGLVMQQYFLQDSLQRGLLNMLEVFGKKYLIELKSYNMLEPLLNFLSKEATQQQIKQDEPLISAEVLNLLIGGVKNAASYTNRSTGQYGEILLYIDEKNKKSAMLERKSDEEHGSEFFNFNIDYTVNDLKENDKRKDSNQCAPKLPQKEGQALGVVMYKSSAFRMPRSDVIFMKSKDLKSLDDHIMGTLNVSNVVVTDSSTPLLPIMKNLAIKVMGDKRYQPSAQVRFVVVNDKAFQGAMSHINQEPISREASKGSLITKMNKKIDIVQRKLSDPDQANDFISEFLEDLGQDYNEYLTQTVPAILKKHLAEDFSVDEVVEREKEEKRMLEQLKNLDKATTAMSNIESSASRSNARAVKSNDRTPDFMSKFTADSTKLLDDNGEDFFQEMSSSFNRADFKNSFEEIVFEQSEDMGKMQRRQLHSSLLKINQLISRSIWLKIVSSFTSEETDSDTQNLISAPAMFNKICDLIHDSNMAASYQRIYFGDMNSQEVARDQISSLLRFFGSLPSSGKFTTYFIKDFLKRADMTIDQVRKDGYQELQNYRLKDLRKVSKLQNVLDPNNLMFLSRQIFSHEKYLNESQKGDMAKVIFDLHLGFAIILKNEQDQEICYNLLKGCSWALDQIIENQDSFMRQNSTSLNSLLTGDMITGLFSKMNENDSRKKQLITELIFRLDTIFKYARSKMPENAPSTVPFKDSEAIQNLVSAYGNLQSGKKFTSLMSRIKLLALLNSPHSDLVKKFGQSLYTDKRMYKTYFKKKIQAQCNILITVDDMTTADACRISREQDQKAVIVDAMVIKKGQANSMRINTGEDICIEFPIQLNSIKWSGRMVNRDGETQRNDTYTTVPGVSAVKVYARHYHAMFVTETEAIYGMGFRVQGRDSSDGDVRMITKPEDCKDYLKVTTGKFFRLIVTKTNKLFFAGQNKKYMVGKDVDVNQWKHQFTEIKDFYPMDAGEGVIDVAGGKHFMLVLSTSNKLYGSGSTFWSAVSGVRSNQGDDSDLPFKLSSPEGWKPIKVWACDRYVNAIITCENIEDPTKFKSFCIGADYDMVGCDDSSSRESWAAPKVPEGIYFDQVSSQGMSVYATDNEGYIWEWGDHRISNKSGSPPFFDKHGSNSGRSTPYRFIWFKNNEKDVLQVESGAAWAMIKVRDTKTEMIEMYCYSDSCTDGRAGQGLTEVYTSTFQKCSDDYTDCVDFAAGREASFVAFEKKVEFLPSILEEDDSYRGLVHFFKQRGVWKFVKEEDLATEKLGFPEIVYATRHPIKDFKNIKDDPDFLPDLETIIKSSNRAKKSAAFNIKSTLTSDVITRERLYYAKYVINDHEQEVFLTEADVLQGGQFFDTQPIVFFSVSGPVLGEDWNQLPMLDQDKLFFRSTKDNEQMQLSITNTGFDKQEILDIPDPNPEFTEEMNNIRDFNRLQDLELIRAIDQLREENFSGGKMQDLKASQFEAEQFKLAANSSLSAVDPELLQNRIKLLVGFSAAASTLLPFTFHESKPAKGQLSALIKENNIVIIPSIKKQLFMEKVAKYWDERGTSLSCAFPYNRQLAADFKETAVKNDPRFVTESTFGQMFTQLQLRDSEFTMMQNQHNSFDISFLNREADAEKEDNQSAFVFRHMELDLMSDKLPLYIRTPNGRHNAGQKRDCFILNPRMTNPDWFKCYQFIGALIGRVIFKTHLFFGVPMAPTFWMLSKDEQPRLKDFAHEDARLAKRLAKFDEEEFFEDDIWVWTNSADQVVPIDEEDPERPVTRENFADFQKALLKKLTNECQVQMTYMKKGISHSLGDADHFKDYINWHDTMELVEMEKMKDYSNMDLIKSIVVYKDVQDDHEQIKRFWTVYEKLNRENKKLFFNFTGGRSHLTDKAHRMQKLTIRVDSSIPENGKPKSLPTQFELILPESYDSEEKFRECLIEVIAEGIGLDSDPL